MPATTPPTQHQVAADFLTPGYRIVGHTMVARTGLKGLGKFRKIA